MTSNANMQSADAARLEAFGAEIDALYQRTKRELGERDVRYIRRVIHIQRGFAIAGRALLFAGAFPPAWIAGTACLAVSKIIENMEIGHNVMHGQYDFSQDPALSSRHYEWDNVCPGDQWRHSHNYLHHTFTNVSGVDHDLGYRILRVEDAQPWRLSTFFQPLYAAALALFFEWGVALHDVDVRRFIADPASRTPEDAAKLRDVAKKAGRQALADYVLFPLLAGPSALYVLAGNATANFVRNLWAFAVIFCGHFPDGTRTFPATTLDGESRGAFYLRQMQGSANFDGSFLLHFMSGHLSHQIEHHMFPDIPAHRYPEMAREVRAIAAKHGFAYNTASLGRQFWSVVKRIFRLALPPRAVTAA
jgi:linoleoyl-CoA desaturase